MGFEEKLAAEWARKIREMREPKPAPTVEVAPEPSPSVVATASAAPPVEVVVAPKDAVAAKPPVIRTESKRHMTKRRLAMFADPNDDQLVYERPKTRGDCLEMERPCPFVGCKYHLYMDVTPAGSIHLNFPDLEVWELIDTCVLDVAEDGDVPMPGRGEGEGLTLDALGVVFGVTRERIRQIEVSALAKLQRKAKILADFADGYGVKRRAPQLDASDELEEQNDDDDG